MDGAAILAAGSSAAKRPLGLALPWLLVFALACGEPGGEARTSAADAGANSADAGLPVAEAAIPGEPLEIPLPDVEAADLDGTARRIREFGGRVTVLNFWATWCVPCLKEIPELVALQDSLGPAGLRVVGIAVASGDPEDVRAFARKHGIDYALLQASFRWARRHFTVFGIPITLVVDEEGVIRRRFVGPQSFETFRAAAEPHLAGARPRSNPTEGGSDVEAREGGAEGVDGR